ncbi:MAG: zinc ABC transporter substrate-binding protein [Deinococcus sp.]|nr:zinc ABC transporter substrate-binding protein [Deinococcus sp.]
MKGGKQLVVSGVLILLLAGAFGPAVARSKLNVVTTVAPLTNIVFNVTGSLVNLHGIIPEGINSHTFEPTPADVAFIASADVVFLNGLNLEVPTEELVDAAGNPGVRVVKLGDLTISPEQYIYDFSFPRENGDPNPHLWPNVAYAANYARIVRDTLMELDPVNARAYQANSDAYLFKLGQLDQGIFASVHTVPELNRGLLTYHDSFPYFAQRYGMTIIGAIQPSDFSEPSPREVVAIIAQIRRERVPAIFGSEVFPSTVLDQIAREVGTVFVSTLRDDDLPGEPGDPNHTYVALMLQNMQNMLIPLGGNVDALVGIDPTNVTQ